MTTPSPNYFLGRIHKIIDPDLYEVEIEIPGVTKEAKAYPFRNEPDEPKVGDVCLVLALDPVWNSTYYYSRLKENDFIGIRARGKKIQMSESEIEIGIFPDMNEKNMEKAPYPEDDKAGDPGARKHKTPDSTSWIRIDRNGNIDIKMESHATINIEGNCDIKVNGDTTISCPKNITLTGGGTLKTGSGVPGAPGMGGFCCTPSCFVTGKPHTTNEIKGI